MSSAGLIQGYFSKQLTSSTGGGGGDCEAACERWMAGAGSGGWAVAVGPGACPCGSHAQFKAAQFVATDCSYLHGEAGQSVLFSGHPGERLRQQGPAQLADAESHQRHRYCQQQEQAGRNPRPPLVNSKPHGTAAAERLKILNQLIF